MKNIIITGVVIVVIVAGGLVYFFFSGKEEPVTNTANINIVLNKNLNLTVNDNVNVSQVNDNENVNLAVENDQDKLTEIARLFAERYGSFSNENNFEHLESVRAWMTESLRSETDAYIENEKLKPRQEFFAVNTQVYSVKLENLEESTAGLLISTQRTERNAASTTDSFFQPLELKFVKQGDQWLVNKVTWKEKTVY